MAAHLAAPAPLESGVWAILPTPFTPDGAVDLASVTTCVAFQRARGVTGLVALGVLGEASALTVDEMEQVLTAVVAAADGLPVVAGLDPVGTDEACALAERLAAAAPGARAVMAKVPSADVTTTATHLRAVASAAGCGVVIQDHPARTGVTIDADALAEAARACGVAIAVKAEASPSAPAVARLVERLGGAVPVFGGLGGVGLLDELAAGAAGAMTGFAFPEGLVATVDAMRTGGFAAARAAWSPWLPLAVFEAQGTLAMALRKELLRRRGALAHAGVRPPTPALPPELAVAIDAHLAAVPAGTIGDRHRAVVT